MLRYILQRPVAIFISFIALIIAGLMMIRLIPVSLLPDIDVPQIVVRVNYPNTPAQSIESSVLKPIREALATLDNLNTVESKAASHTGIIFLKFKYGTKMNMAFIEVNEKIDRITSQLPKDISRPQVIRVNTSDIPIVRIQVVPKNKSELSATSLLAERILKRRIEQISGVSIVQINGLREKNLIITPDALAIRNLGVNEDVLINAFNSANLNAGGLNIKEGQLKYFVKFNNSITTIRDIQNLPIRTKHGTTVPLDKIAKIEYHDSELVNSHLFNGLESLVITVQKTSDGRMADVMESIGAVVRQFKVDYPSINFELTQDQTFLLDAGISNLKQDLIFGGILTVSLLFLFLGSWGASLIMAINIPISLIITFIFFYLFNISFNIISLSGLTLGIGMLIDNSIVVIDSISRKYKEGLSPLDSSVFGVVFVYKPVLSQMLTTVAVYLPLIMLSGIAGAFVYDQSVALTISLCVSLLTAFVLTPLLYKLFLSSSVSQIDEDTKFYTWILMGYHRMIDHILRYRKYYILFTIILMPIGFIIAYELPIKSLPDLEKKESLMIVDWNIPVTIEENTLRVEQLSKYMKSKVILSESDIGIKQFLDENQLGDIQTAEIFYSCQTSKERVIADSSAAKWLTINYPECTYQILDATNAFTKLFKNDKPFFEARFRKVDFKDNYLNSNDDVVPIEKIVPNSKFQLGDGFKKQQNYEIYLDFDLLSIYNISYGNVEAALKKTFGVQKVTRIKNYGEITFILISSGKETLNEKLNVDVVSETGGRYKLKDILKVKLGLENKFITADRKGIYESIFYDRIPNIRKLESIINQKAIKQGYEVSFEGAYFDNLENISRLGYIFLLVVILLYLILAFQYENLILPFIVMLTIPLGITGSMFFLWLVGGSLNVMSAIGFVVILGLIVDDPILKIETLNRLVKSNQFRNAQNDNLLLRKMIHEAGNMCLKPLLLVSLTTTIALVPVLILGGIGNELQRPLSFVIIGGLSIGTFFSTWFTPLAYWYYIKWKKNE